MTLERVNAGGLVLLGCGKMGSAMLQGWLAEGVDVGSVYVLDPYPSDWLQGLADQGLHLNAELPDTPAVCLIAVKPQMMGEALPRLQGMGNGSTAFISIAAGITIAAFEGILGADSPIIRSIPNTPAAIGRGITALIGNDKITDEDLKMAESLLRVVGQTVRLDDESQMDAVTAVSGSGPAYVFHLIEALAGAGEAAGLPADLSMRLAKATVGGAGQLAEDAPESPTQLRINVTSPAGTTEAALNVLMDGASGFPMLMKKAVKAAADRGRELGRE
ncbi:MAG: pyrroline-5-carboxylate reductase [Rhodobacteraceae bacterium]|nr:pyrroline-5-carboxylate reductase [Paracoccaceae bacterium]